MKTVTINPVTRLEGHGKISIFLNDEGNVENAYFQVPELRGFEKFCEGRPVEEMPDITSRICGVCPEAHHIASTKALDQVFHVEPPPAAKKLRELLYSAFFIADHITHFYILAGPDFVMGPSAPKAERNILGVIRKVGLEVGSSVIKHRSDALDVIAMIGGKRIHPSCGVPGGVSKPITEDERARIESIAKSEVEFAKFTMKLFDDIVLKNKDYVDLITSDNYATETYCMGTVDEQNHVNFYDGKIRVVDPEGHEFAKFPAADYQQYISEHVEPWTYLKFPYLKKIGWKGLVGGKDSGVYKATPLARLNVSEGMATPTAQAEYKRLYETLGQKPVHSTLATHWARLVELVYASERLVQLSQDPDITNPNVRNIPTQTPDEGVGAVEAPRGTLFHHYKTDAKGMVKNVNLIVATTNNHAAISMSIKQAAEGFIKKGEVSDGILNMVEMAFRAYDPCYACATHTLPGQMPLDINIYNKNRAILHNIRRP
ncbi:MAG: Ni/Fe hydrogenase subunit alpha [Candidatus Bathyarchaeia archaeon]|jgi:F420-non-reducing hydrogenase large subunit